MGQMNIKNELLIEKIKRLADRKGTTATEALHIAVDAELARDDAEVRKRFDAIMASARAIRDAAGGELMSNAELDRLLYDPETGLPR